MSLFNQIVSKRKDIDALEKNIRAQLPEPVKLKAGPLIRLNEYGDLEILSNHKTIIVSKSSVKLLHEIIGLWYGSSLYD